MIQNGIKMYLLIAIMSYNLFAGGPEVHINYKEYYKQNARYLYKIWGFDYCLNYTKNMSFNALEKQWVKEKQSILESTSKESLEELKHFIDRYRAKHNLLVICLKLYDSKEYQNEVERIVKKYCKDCK